MNKKVKILNDKNHKNKIKINKLKKKKELIKPCYI